MNLNMNVKERMAYYHVPGVSTAFIDNGLISGTGGFGVLEAGTPNEVTDRSIFHACSISKFFTSMLVLRLVGNGVLDLDEDVNRRLVSWKVPFHKQVKNRKVTLRALLSHQSGITDPQDSFMELNHSEGPPSMVELLNGNTSYCKKPIRVEFEPGSDFQYSDAGFCVIQQILEDVSGKTFEALMHELVFEPLNLKDSLILQPPPATIGKQFSSGHNKEGKPTAEKYPIYPYPAAAGIWTTPSDLGNLAIELMNALNGNSKIGITEHAAKELLTPQGCKEWAGLGVFLDGSGLDTEISSLGWGIGFQCLLVAYPYRRRGAVLMTNADLGVHQLEGLLGEMVNSLSF